MPTPGGVGKTTICSALAVRGAEESRRVALLDLDPQESLASWWTRRGKTKNPKLFEVDAAVEAIELLISESWDWVFIDTGPARIDLIESDFHGWLHAPQTRIAWASGASS